MRAILASIRMARDAHRWGGWRLAWRVFVAALRAPRCDICSHTDFEHGTEKGVCLDEYDLEECEACWMNTK